MLARDQVIVFVARPDDVAAGAPAVLDDADRAHVARFHFARDRELATASRTAVRLALSACSEGVAPSAWRFAIDAHGRPEIDGPHAALGLRFNASNSHGMVACAVSRERAVGVDVEPWRDVAPPELVERCFAPVERAALRALPPAAQARRFVELWVLKEAYIKARGLGMSLPLESFAFDDREGEPRLAFAHDDDVARWQVRRFDPGRAHAGAVCVARDRAGAPLRIEIVFSGWLRGTLEIESENEGL